MSLFMFSKPWSVKDAVELPTLFIQVYTRAVCKHNIPSLQHAWTSCSVRPEHRGWCHGAVEEEECKKVHYEGYLTLLGATCNHVHGDFWFRWWGQAATTIAGSICHLHCMARWRTGARQTDGCVAQRKGKEQAASCAGKGQEKQVHWCQFDGPCRKGVGDVGEMRGVWGGENRWVGGSWWGYGEMRRVLEKVGCGHEEMRRGNWRKLVGLRRKEGGVLRYFASTHTHMSRLRSPNLGSQEPVLCSMRGDRGWRAARCRHFGRGQVGGGVGGHCGG